MIHGKRLSNSELVNHLISVCESIHLKVFWCELEYQVFSIFLLEIKNGMIHSKRVSDSELNHLNFSVLRVNSSKFGL